MIKIVREYFTAGFVIHGTPRYQASLETMKAEIPRGLSRNSQIYTGETTRLNFTWELFGMLLTARNFT